MSGRYKVFDQGQSLEEKNERRTNFILLKRKTKKCMFEA